MHGPPPPGSSPHPEREHEPLSTSEQTKPLSPSAPKLKGSEEIAHLQKTHATSPNPPGERLTNEDHGGQQNTVFNQQLLIASTPLRDITGSQLIDSLTVMNQQNNKNNNSCGPS